MHHAAKLVCASVLLVVFAYYPFAIVAFAADFAILARRLSVTVLPIMGQALCAGNGHLLWLCVAGYVSFGDLSAKLREQCLHIEQWLTHWSD